MRRTRSIISSSACLKLEQSSTSLQPYLIKVCINENLGLRMKGNGNPLETKIGGGNHRKSEFNRHEESRYEERLTFSAPSSGTFRLWVGSCLCRSSILPRRGAAAAAEQVLEAPAAEGQRVRPHISSLTTSYTMKQHVLDAMAV